MRRLQDVRPVHVAAYIEQLQAERSAATVKQHLAGIRMLFDWLVTGQIMPSNPAHAVRGPRHSVSKGATPVLSSEEATALLTGMDISTVVGLRDRALIAVMTYTFARVGAVVGLAVEDYFSQKKRWWLRSSNSVMTFNADGSRRTPTITAGLSGPRGNSYRLGRKNLRCEQ
jgi:integrase/recombinase XerD